MAPDPDVSSIEGQVAIILRALEGKQLSRASPVFNVAIKWIQCFPTFLDQGLRERLKKAACATFSITEAELLASIEGIVTPLKPQVLLSNEDKLRAALPKGGWFEWYDEYTRYNEAPLSYHIFSSLCILGSALGRRVHLNMGHFNIWPNYCIILVGPTGRVKKTTAADVAKDFIKRHALCPIMSDEPSPQALTSALSQAGGHHFVYGGELSVFFGKDKFKEAMIPKFLRMLDSPEEFEVDTIGRGKETIKGLAISFIGGTTPGQFGTTMPAVVTSSGFMNRFVFVVEHDTDRVFPRPWKGDYENKLNATIDRFKHLEGVVDFAPGVEKGWWNNWYRLRKQTIKDTADETLIEVMERLPGHLLRTAMLMHLVQCDNFQLCESCLESSKLMLEYLEKNTPALIQGIKQSATANDSDHVLGMLVKLGGAADHSTLLRRCAPRMNAQQFKQHIKTLEESSRLKVGKRGMGVYYIITEDTQHALS